MLLKEEYSDAESMVKGGIERVEVDINGKSVVVGIDDIGWN